MYLEKSNNQLLAYSEKDILIRKWTESDGKKKRQVIRPDITIYQGETVVAIIECKTQLGWNRNDWEIDFNRRSQLLNSVYPKAKAYLLVMTGSNWSGFSNHKRLNNDCFCLLNDIWPTDFKNSNQIMSKIEELFSKI